MKLLTASRTIGLSICIAIIVLTIINDFVYYIPIADELYGINRVYDTASYDYLASIIAPNVSSLVPLIIVLFLIYLFFDNKKVKLILVLIYPIYYLVLNLNVLALDSSNVIIFNVLFFAMLYHIFDFLYPRKNYRNIFTGAILIQICIVYSFTFLGKLSYPVWWDGGAPIYYALRTDFPGTSAFNWWLSSSDFFVRSATYMTLLFEGLFVFLVFFRKTKLPILAFGVLFHVGIYILMRIEDFSWVMIATYFVFITDKEYKIFFEYIKKWYFKTNNPLLNNMSSM